MGHELIPNSDNRDFEGLLSIEIVRSEDDPPGPEPEPEPDVEAMTLYKKLNKERNPTQEDKEKEEGGVKLVKWWLVCSYI